MLTVVLGGARSGKSRYAQSLMGDGPIVYIATSCPGNDDEMQRRVAKHRAGRPAGWTTIEVTLNVGEAIAGAAPGAGVLVDCVTVWLSNMMWAYRDLGASDLEHRIMNAVNGVCADAAARDVVLVSNEVGSGIIPEHVVSRLFRDLQGFANQRLALAADRVVFLIAGLPIVLKDPLPG